MVAGVNFGVDSAQKPLFCGQCKTGATDLECDTAGPFDTCPVNISQMTKPTKCRENFAA